MMQKAFYNPVNDVPLDAVRAWKLYKKLRKLSDWLWENFEDDFNVLDNEETNGHTKEDLPF
jgi:hypothetical protein